MVHRQLSAVLLCMLVIGLARAAPEGEPRAVSGRYALVIRGGLPLDEALQELARQSGIQIVFFSQVTAGRSAPALSGEYTIPAAITGLLAGSDLTFRQVNPRTIEVRQQPETSARANGKSRVNTARRSMPATVSGDPMQEVHVVATVEQLVATRIPTPLSEIPQSMSVISSEQIRQQNSFDLGDVLRNAPGIATRRNSSLEEGGYSRAFQLTSFHVDGSGAVKPTLNNGVSLYSGSPELSEYDRVEVLRGSDALFTGNGNPGATLSLIRKRALATPALEMNATVGSWNNYRMELDATGPLTDDGALRARADVVYARRDYFFDLAHLERKKAFAVLEYDVTPAATLTAGASYQLDKALPLFSGLPIYVDGSDPHLPRSLALTFDWAFYNTRQREVYLQYRQQVADDWALKLNASSLRAAADSAYGSFASPINKRNQYVGSPTAYFSLRPDNYALSTADVTLTGELNWLGLREEIAIGGDVTRVKARQSLGLMLAFGPPLIDAVTFDPAAYADPRSTREPDIDVDAEASVHQYGVFASLRVDLTDAWSVTGGGRLAGDTLHETGRLKFLFLDFPSVSQQLGSSHVVTPYGALMYRINDHFSWYASYADVYLSQLSHPLRADGKEIGPQHGVNLESGIKGVWREGALNASLAVYRIAQRHFPVQDGTAPAGTTSCCFVSGTVHSRGAELEVDGELAPGWLISSGYTYNLNETADGSIPTTATPRHLLKIWTGKTLPGDLSRWTVGGSLRAQTPARGTSFFNCSVSAATCEAGEAVGQNAYAVLDLRAGFEVDRNWQVALSVNNVLDKRYFLSQNLPASTVWYGEPRNFMVRVDGRY